jgi:hypothetical protein
VRQSDAIDKVVSEDSIGGYDRGSSTYPFRGEVGPSTDLPVRSQETGVHPPHLDRSVLEAPIQVAADRLATSV